MKGRNEIMIGVRESEEKMFIKIMKIKEFEEGGE